jgi:hypothetical protein
MASLTEHLAAKIAFWHAQRVQRSFLRAIEDLAAAEQQALERALPQVHDSVFGREHALGRVRSVADLRAACPLRTYDDFEPWIERVAGGEFGALFTPGLRPLMFATSSGTTAAPKRIPVTPAFVADYRRGWNTFGLKLLSDHPRAVLRPLLQSSGRWDHTRTSAGVPCGAITGLLAKTQKRVVRRFYVGTPEVAHIEDPTARYYTLMRLGVTRDVAWAITASPATLIQMARVASERSEDLIRDVHDGTLSPEIVGDDSIRRALERGLRPSAARARELAEIRHAAAGLLRPRDYWRLEFLACWLGGSMSFYTDRLAAWWGPVPVRDPGLLASEGRVSIPFSDNTPVGVLDCTSGVFEFIPLAEAASRSPNVLGPRELEVGQDYAVVLTNTTGLIRYRLDDVLRVRGRLGQAPLVEFLHRAGRVASIAGEKLTEHQVVAAVRQGCAAVGYCEFDFVLGPRWGDPPFYVLSAEAQADEKLVAAIDTALQDQNEEYASRRKSNRLGPLRPRMLPAGTLTAMDRRISVDDRRTPEQYKRQCLFMNPGDDDQALELPATQSTSAT